MSGLIDKPNGSGRRGPRVSVVLPCLNEVESVGLCVREAWEALAGAGLDGEVIVVDNGSTDGSAAEAVASGARIVSEGARGYGSALRAGFAAARGEVVVMADADLTYDLSRIPDLVRPVLAGDADFVLGSRAGGANRATMPLLHRVVGTPVISYLIARASGARVGVRDSQSGFRAIRRTAVLGLGLRSTGMELASEMLVRAYRGGLRVREIPTGYRPRVGLSKLQTWSDGMRHLRLILLLAPDLVLIGPGLLLASAGLALSILGLVQPAGLALGSLRWQPVFFSSIALILGIEAVLAGMVLAHRLSLPGAGVTRFDLVGRPGFGRACLVAGLGAAAAGAVIDGWLFLVWVEGQSAPARALALAALAQSLIVIGATLAMFSVVNRLVASGTAQAAPEPDGRKPALAPAVELMATPRRVQPDGP